MRRAITTHMQSRGPHGTSDYFARADHCARDVKQRRQWLRWHEIFASLFLGPGALFAGRQAQQLNLRTRQIDAGPLKRGTQRPLQLLYLCRNAQHDYYNESFVSTHSIVFRLQMAVINFSPQALLHNSTCVVANMATFRAIFYTPSSPFSIQSAPHVIGGRAT